MTESVRYVLELQTNERCAQGCPHCVFSQKRASGGARGVSSEMLDMLHLTQLAIQQSCLANRLDSFRNINIASGYPDPKQPPLFESFSLLPDFPPEYLSFALGDLSRIPLRDLCDDTFVDRLRAYAPFEFKKRPCLHIDYRLPLQGLTSSADDFEKAVSLGKKLLQSSRSDSYPFDPHGLVLSETINAYQHPGDLEDPDKVDARFEQIQSLIGKLFPERPYEPILISKPRPSSKNFWLMHSVHPVGQLFTYMNRVLPKFNADLGVPSEKFSPHEIGISFFSDFVWINHSTYNTGDTTIRFMYDEYFEILKASEGQGRVLKMLLEKRIQERRARD